MFNILTNKKNLQLNVIYSVFELEGYDISHFKKMLMLGKLIKFYNRITIHKFSILGDCGDLSKYDYKQMFAILYNWKMTLSKGNGYFDAEWECKTNRIKIRYYISNGKFIQIIEEEWKQFKMVIKRNPKEHTKY